MDTCDFHSLESPALSWMDYIMATFLSNTIIFLAE
jgi:hypothetical protein